MPRYTLPQCRNRAAEIGEDGCEMFALDIWGCSDNCFAKVLVRAKMFFQIKPILPAELWHSAPAGRT
jgi:uncharacterized metal-binding protein